MTPLDESSYFKQREKCKIYLKEDNLQLTGSFKIRGAFNKLQ